MSKNDRHDTLKSPCPLYPQKRRYFWRYRRRLWLTKPLKQSHYFQKCGCSRPTAGIILMQEVMNGDSHRQRAGIKLHVGEYGKSSGVPILLIHGWPQSYLCWTKQFGSALKDEARIVALDLRGHGMSDAPAEADQYTDGDKWARAFWRTRRAPVRTTFRPTLRQFVDFCAPASSSQFRRTISRKFWPST
jgi:hypothetical protein